MEPIPETVRAVEELGPFADGDDLLEELRAVAGRVRDAVPDCVGLSLASMEHGVTFTLVASTETVAVLDAVQYVDGGPCLASLETGSRSASTSTTRWMSSGGGRSRPRPRRPAFAAP